MAKDYFANDPLPSLYIPESQPVKPAEQQGRIGDTIDAGQAGLLSAFGGMFDFVGAESIARSLYESSDDQYAQMSDRGREAMSKQFVEEDEAGNLSFGEGATDLDTWILTMANVAGQFAGTAVPGAGWASGAAKVASLGLKGKKVANIASMGATGGAAATGQGMEQARQEIENMPDDILAESPLFADIYRGVHQGNPEQSTEDKWNGAKKALANKVAQEVRTDPKVLIANFAASAIGDPIIGKALVGARLAQSGALRSAIGGFATEGATEAVQAGVQELGINQALQPVDNRDEMKGVVAAGLNEGLAGGGFGAAAGGFGGLLDRNPKTDPLLELPPPSDAPIDAPVDAPDPATQRMKDSNPMVGDAMQAMDQQAQRAKQDMADLDMPTAARQAGFTTAAGAGQFGDFVTSPSQDAIKNLRNQNIADMVADAENYYGPTKDDRFSPIKFTHEGDLIPGGQPLGSDLGPFTPPAPQLDSAVVDGELAPEQSLLPSTWQTRHRQNKEQANAEPKRLGNKDIVFAGDNRPQQQAVERVNQAGKDSQNLLPHKDIIFAGNESGVNVARNGQSFKSEKEARNSKLARQAKRQGATIDVVPFDNGYGWTVSGIDAEGVRAAQPASTMEAGQAQPDQAITNLQSLYDDPNSPPIRLNMTEQEYLSKVDESGNPKGKRAKVYTPSGAEIETEYTIIDAFGGDIQTSNNAHGEVNTNYPKELQPRDRDRASSVAQIARISKTLTPSRLGQSSETDRGAPIIRDNIVESGNGRVLALTEAYRNGRGDEYRQYLIDNAESFGIDRELLDHIDTPILVRKRLTEMTQQDRVAFTVNSNQGAGIELSPSEAGKSDANLLTDDDLKQLNIPENGDVLSGDNQSFLYQFAKKLGDNESAKYRQKDGSWNSQFATRVNNAIFAKSYNDSDLLANISESTNQESKNVMTALMRAAGKVSEVKGLDSDAGNALSETITQAAQAIIKSRRDGTTVANTLSQVDLLNGQTQPEVEKLALLLESNIRSANKMAAVLDSVTEQLRVAAQNSDQVDIFTGEVAPKPTINEVLDNANQDTENTGPSVRAGTQGGAQQSNPTQSVEPDNEAGTAGSSESPSLGERKEAVRTSKLDNAANAISAKKREKAEKLKKLIASKKGQLNSGIDPEVMIAVAEVGALSIAEGAVKFAQWARDVIATTRAVGIDDKDVKPFLKEAYAAVSANPEKYGVNDDIADSMDSMRTVRQFDVNSIESDSDVSTTSNGLESTSPGTNQEQEYQSNNEDESNQVGSLFGGAEQDANQELRSNSELGISNDDGPILGAGGVESLLDETGVIRDSESPGGAGVDGRGSSDNDNGAPTEPAATAAITEATERVKSDQDAEQTAANVNHKAKWGDESDILKSVPVLMEEQAGDIAKIENRFFGTENPGPGYQNTNGTGTGKTFVGLGVVKRLVQAGKGNILIAVPNDGIAQQWVQAGREHFGLDLYLIGSDGGPKTKDIGRGVTITTYATLGSNDGLIRERGKFDLIITDESQNLMGNQQAKTTKSLESLRALTNHDRGAFRRAKAMHATEQDALTKLVNKKAASLLSNEVNEQAAKTQAQEFYKKEQAAISAKVSADREKFSKQPAFDTKVLFLSATPFPYVKNLDYAEGYLYNFTDYGDKFEGGYDNAFNGQNAFFIQNFGYRWRYHKLNTPGAEVDQPLMERQFHETMKEKGVLGGRTLEVKADYRRDFIKVETLAGEKLDDLIEKWRDHEVTAEDGSTTRPYSELAEALNKQFDYTKRIKLVEAIKAEEAVERAKKHIEMGRKVVLFHAYNVGGSFDPVSEVRKVKRELFDQFNSEFPGMTNINFGVLERPLDLFQDEFGDSIRFYNGNVPDKARKIAKDQFNDDNSGVDVIAVQQEAGEAGISLHDITGNKQRVIINIGMPVKPTQFIQIEGRTYRVGVKTDAQFEYLTTGTAFERNIFASKIAGRASTAENLAMGEFARSLKESISEGYLDAQYVDVQSEIGKGGKVSDRPNEIDDWDKAKSFYYANLKRNAKTKSAEGEDYFATPEPLGKKMVEWLQPLPGHRLLEPSIGHAAIGRWFPGTTRNKAVEKSFKLSSLAQMNFNGDVINESFEDLNVINKFEGVAMNPPFGVGGSLAYPHIKKALSHLVNGGRVVALVPDGTMANKKLDALLNDKDYSNIYLAAEIKMANGVFERAGTGVKTKIIVLDRFDSSEDAPQLQSLSFEGAKSVNELFDRIKDVELRERKQPTVREVDTTKYMKADSPGKATGKDGAMQYSVEVLGVLPGSVKDIVDKEAVSEFGGKPGKNGTTYTFDNDDARADFAQYLGKTIEEAQESGIEIEFKAPKPRVVGQQSNEHFEAVGEIYTTKKTGKEFLVTEMTSRVERDVYAELKALAKNMGGWAMSKKFMFSNLDDLTQFNAQAKTLIDGDTDIKFSKRKASSGAKGVGVDKAQAIADKFIGRLNGANGITVKILKDNAEASRLWRMNLDGFTAKGAYSSNTKTVYIIAGNISSDLDLRQTLAHETIAHGGLDTVIGEKAAKDFIERIKGTRSKKAFKKYWDDADKDYFDASEDVKAEEIFARFVEEQPSKGQLKYWWNALNTFISKAIKAVIPGYKLGDVNAMREMMDSIVEGFTYGVNNQEGGGDYQGGIAYSRSRVDMHFKDVTKRTPELQDAAKKVRTGEITAAEYDALVNKYKPVEPYTSIPKPATVEEMKSALDSKKVLKLIDPLKELKGGENVGLRLDIPAYTNSGTWIVTVHEGKTTGRGGAAKTSIGYDSAAMVTNPHFEVPGKPALMIATGKAKGTIATIGGGWVKSSPTEIVKLAEQALGDPNWAQVGMDPERHGYFYDRATMEPIVGGDIALQVGGLVMVKNPKYDNKGDYLFSRTADEDTRTAKEKLGLGDDVEETFAGIAKDKVEKTIGTLKNSAFWNRINEGIFDGLAGIKQAEESVGITDPNMMGYVSARLASGLADVLHGVFHYGAPQWRDGVVQRKEDTKGLLEVFGSLGDDLNDWLAWMGANRAEQLKAEGRENNLTDADIAELKALANGKEEAFEQVRQEYNKINSAILDLAQESGLINDAQRAGFDEEYYVPFFRDMGEVDPEMSEIKRMIIEPHTRKGIAGQSAQIKELKGGAQSTNDLLVNIISRQSTLIDASLKNKAMQEVVNNLAGTEFMTHERSDEAQSRSQQQLNNDGKVRVMINGNPEAYTVSDPALLRALIHVNDVGSQSLFNKMGRSAKRFLTTGITLSPDFIAKNFVRDAAHAWMVNKDDFKFGTDSIKGLRAAFKEDEAYRDLIFSGAAFQGGYIHGADPEAAAQQMRRALRDKGLSDRQVKSYMGSIVNSGSQLLEKYRNVSDKVENANRLSTYNAALAAGKSRRQAAYEAKDLMDYSLKGNYKLIGTMIDMLPFFNARLQGMSKLVRAAKAGETDRVLKVLSANLAMKGIKLAGFSLALAAMNDDDERYQAIPDWDKDINWHFFVGDEPGDHFRIPKPFELGVIFGTMPERLFHTATGTQSGSDLGKAVLNAVGNTLALNPIPQFALPAVEVMVNKSFFKDAPIEGMADEYKQAQDRYNAYTSDTAKLIGAAFNVSPKKVEHLIKGYTGTIGGYVLGASDIVARQALGIESADTPISRYPVIKAFYQGSGPMGSTKFANEFYGALEAANQAYGSYKRAMEEGDTSRQQELLEGEGDKLRSRIAMGRVQRQASKLGKMARAVNDNDSLSGAQKREQLDDIQRQKNALYHSAYVTFKIGEW